MNNNFKPLGEPKHKPLGKFEYPPITSTVANAMIDQMSAKQFKSSSAKENVIAPPFRKLIPLVGEREDCCKYAIDNPCPKGLSYIFLDSVTGIKGKNFVRKATVVTTHSDYSHLVNAINDAFSQSH